VGQDAMAAAASRDERCASRTAKSCGPDLPMLGSTPGSSDVGLAADTPRPGGRWQESRFTEESKYKP
jgi:hypothetical protein